MIRMVPIWCRQSYCRDDDRVINPCTHVCFMHGAVHVEAHVCVQDESSVVRTKACRYRNLNRKGVGKIGIRITNMVQGRSSATIVVQGTALSSIVVYVSCPSRPLHISKPEYVQSALPRRDQSHRLLVTTRPPEERSGCEGRHRCRES